MEDYEKIYNEFWKSIIEPEEGMLDLDQLMKELADYYVLMQSTNKVYSTLTNGKFSKVNTDPDVILSEVEEAHKEDTKSTIEELIYDCEHDGSISVSDIRSYFLMEDKKN